MSKKLAVLALVAFAVLSGCSMFMSGPAGADPLTACRDFDRARRRGNFQDEQQAISAMTVLALDEADCGRLLAEADGHPVPKRERPPLPRHSEKFATQTAPKSAHREKQYLGSGQRFLALVAFL